MKETITCPKCSTPFVTEPLRVAANDAPEIESTTCASCRAFLVHESPEAPWIEAGDAGYRRKRTANGWVDLHKQEDGTWLLGWIPDEGQSRSFEATSWLPSDFPGTKDPDVLLAWAWGRYGAAQAHGRQAS